MGSDNRGADNQAPPLVGHNVVTSDRALVNAVTRFADAATVGNLATLGAEAFAASLAVVTARVV